MIVDDEPFNLIALEGILEMSNIQSVEKAFNGREGLSKFIKFKVNRRDGLCKGVNHLSECFKLIFTDFNMPIMNGLQMVEQIIKEVNDINKSFEPEC